ncbi:pseudoazurin [Amphritea balenae]|uniref:Pseudoazurin n=1 Tax=Amphritea balenae TaxID=452629 RepID=A0A3P1SIH1_9GAMM|nr:pseudoazurin [Amphritea balenae]RRC96780.1 pseudoazurin [Amphritea balenae]GGK84791.1 pseudoazurin [Amphritea balenae]
MKLKSLIVAVLMLATSVVMAAEYTVEMKNNGVDGSMVFEPAVVRAEVGDTIHFVPTAMGHNAQTVKGLVPEGATTWKGKMNKPVSVTLDKEGVYVYKCRPHTVMAMVGVVVAGNAVNLEQIKADSAALSGKFVTNKDRLTSYLDQLK